MNSLARTAMIFSSLVMVFAIGCGGNPDAPQPVSGNVSVKGGSPLRKGVVRFTNVAGKKNSAIGEIDPSGSFQLSSTGKNDGVPAGDYTVTFAGTEGGQDYDHPNDPVIVMIHEKYNSDSTTDLKFTVKPGRNTCNFELDPPQQK